ncbi:FUSC family protein [Nesterenkonia halobia]|uniref:FUSC family protein n=1 Tax=Nesterenkonia halobia TaxID=37922 RepID=A0ABP6RGD6_9MICC
MSGAGAAPSRPDGRGRRRELVWPASLGRLEVEVGLRAAVAVGVSLMVLHAAGAEDLAAYAAFAAFVILYGRGETYRRRLTTLAVVGTVFLAIIAAAMAVALRGSPDDAVVGGLAVVAALGMVVSQAMALKPFGPIFMVFAFGVISSIPLTPEQFLPRLGISAATVVFCLLLTLIGRPLRRLPGPHRRLLGPLDSPRRALHALSDPALWGLAALAAAGTAAAMQLSSLVGLGHSYWAAVAVAACMPRPHAPLSLARIIHRVVGTTLGVGGAWALLVLDPPTPVVILLVAAFQFIAELFVVRVYWFALLFITPLALMVSHLSQPRPVDQLVVDRVLDTLLGGLVLLPIMGVVHLVRRRAAVR